MTQKSGEKARKNFRMAAVFQGLLAVSLPFFLFACATTTQTHSAKHSGFLWDYSELRKGKKGEALLIYINEEADWASYDKILIDSVTIWVNDKTAIKNVPEEERQAIADYLYGALYSQLRKDYEIVDEPGPHVLRLRVGLTEAKGSRVVLDTVTTVLPMGFVLSHGKKLATGTHSFVGKAGVEAEIEDSITDVQLAAVVDERAGGKTLEGVGTKWSDVEAAFEHWAERLRLRLAELRGAEKPAM